MLNDDISFEEAMDIVSNKLANLGTNIKDSKAYDGMIVKRLASSNTLDEKNSKQSHIAITGEQMSIFPVLLPGNLVDKKYLYFKIPVNLYATNIEYLNPDKNLSSEMNILECYTSVWKRGGSSPQIQLSLKNKDSDNFIAFRKMLHVGSYMIVLKHKGEFVYDFLGVSSKDVSEDMDEEFMELDNKFFYKKSITGIEIDKFLTETDYISEINEETSPYNGKTAENIIYYGAPGTGKSYGVSEYVNDHICENQEKYDASKDDCKYVFRATLHPEYTYSDFVGQVMPVVEKNGDEKSITYDFKPGVFTEALTYAEKHSDEAVFLVLEELSRANVAAVFGDVFQLLDRKDNGRSEYGIDNALIANVVYADEKRKVFIPGNLFIIGTVNTSDQNVFAMDTAFKRRFNWKYVSINVPEEKKAEFNQDNNPEFMIDGIKTDWLEFYTELDKFITSELGMTEDKQIGPYFIKFRKKNNEYDEPREIIRDKLLQYLWDDVQGVARNMYAEKTLFLKKFTSYSMLYDAFDKGESVFSDEFTSRLGKSGKVVADDEASDQND